MQQAFIWNNLSPKIKHNTICNSFEEGGLKNDHLNSKITSHQCSWIDWLYNDKFHEWKLIPLYLVKYTFEINFKFHSNLDFDGSKILTFPSFYKQLFCNWGIFLLVLLINLPFYHNHFGITKIWKKIVNLFTLKNLQIKISFSCMIFLTLKMTVTGLEPTTT